MSKYYTLLSNGGGFVNESGWALFTKLLLVRVVPFLLSDDVAAAACLIWSKVALFFFVEVKIRMSFELFSFFYIIFKEQAQRLHEKLRRRDSMKRKIPIFDEK